MTEPATRRTLLLTGTAWIALVALHAALQLLAPRSVIGDPLLPFWARASLLATEAVAIAFLLLLAAAPIRLAGDRLPPWAQRGIRCLFASLLLLALASSWATFWLSGQFLDRQGFLFASTNFSSVLGYAVRVHPFLVYGLPWVLVALAVAACEGVPRWTRGVPAAVEKILVRGAMAGAGLALAVALCGELGHRFATRKITDPLTGATYSRDDLYRIRRERNAGPLTHLASKALASADAFEGLAPLSGADPERRPIESMDRYLAKVDRDRLKK